MDINKRLTGSLLDAGPAALLKRWSWPIFFSISVIAVTCLAYYAVQLTVRRNLDSKLTAILETDVKALTIWTAQQHRDVSFLAGQDEVRRLAKILVDEAGVDEARVGDVPSDSLVNARTRLESIFQEACRTFGYFDYRLIKTDRTILLDREASAVGTQVQDVWGPYASATESGRPNLAPVSRDHFSVGNGSQAASEFLLVGPVQNESGDSIAVLAFGIPLKGDFSEILSVARAGKTGETYAFDGEGTMISDSRFAQPGEGRETALNAIAMSELVRQAIVGRQENAGASMGKILTSYVDYRGKKAVGAYQWLPQYELGIVTKLDYKEAYSPGLMLRNIFFAFFLIGVLAVGVNIVNTLRLSNYKLRMAKERRRYRKLGQYTLQDKIGSGGMGEVYRANHAMLRRPTAVKLLRPDRISESAVGRFENEVQYTAMLTHPNTIAIYDFGRTSDGTFYYAMEYLDGLDLGRVIHLGGPMPAGRVVNILRQVCNSLSEAHEAGLVHRDIKPANVILVQRGSRADIAKVLDFGLVWDVDQNSENRQVPPAGTPAYMSPESFSTPGAVSAQSDLYAVGALGYFLLTGENVFDGSDMATLSKQHQFERPVSPEKKLGAPVDGQLSKLLMSCLSKNPAERPGSAAEMSRLLSKCTVAQTWSRADAARWWALTVDASDKSVKATAANDDQVTETLIVPLRHLNRSSAVESK